MKTYNSPMLQVVGISKKDIIATSLVRGTSSVSSGDCDAPGLRMFELDNSWDSGY